MKKNILIKILNVLDRHPEFTYRHLNTYLKNHYKWHIKRENLIEILYYFDLISNPIFQAENTKVINDIKNMATRYKYSPYKIGIMVKPCQKPLVVSIILHKLKILREIREYSYCSRCGRKYVRYNTMYKFRTLCLRCKKTRNRVKKLKYNRRFFRRQNRRRRVENRHITSGTLLMHIKEKLQTTPNCGYIRMWQLLRAEEIHAGQRHVYIVMKENNLLQKQRRQNYSRNKGIDKNSKTTEKQEITRIKKVKEKHPEWGYGKIWRYLKDRKQSKLGRNKIYALMKKYEMLNYKREIITRRFKELKHGKNSETNENK